MIEKSKEASGSWLMNNIGAFILGVFLFLSQYVFNDTQTSINRLEDNQRTLITKLAMQEAQIAQLLSAVSQASTSRYTAIEAKTYNDNFQRQLDSLYSRLERLEQKKN